MAKRREVFHVSVDVEAESYINPTPLDILEALVLRARGKEPVKAIEVSNSQIKSLAKKFTVVGSYPETGGRFAHQVWAETADSAEAQGKQLARGEADVPVDVAGVFEGHLVAVR